MSNLSYLIKLSTKCIFASNDYFLVCQMNRDYIDWLNKRFNYNINTKSNTKFAIKMTELFLYIINYYPLQEISQIMFQNTNHYPYLEFIRKCLLLAQNSNDLTDTEKIHMYKSGLYLYLSRKISAYSIDSYFNNEFERIEYFKTNNNELYSMQFYAEIKEFYKNVWRSQMDSSYAINKFENYLYEIQKCDINWHPLTIIAINELVMSFLRKKNIPDKFINVYRILKQFSTLEYNDKLIKKESKLFLRAI